jgi:tetratricopeptide (TPR) repeat protein
VFGAQDKGKQRLGTLRNPTGIERHGETIYVLDKDKNALITYQTTAFAQQVHEGVRLYMEGYYVEAKPYFENVLNFNGSYIMAYQAIADAYYKQRDFENALQYYKYAEDQKGYSEAYWELRNVQLQKYLTTAIIALVALSVVNGVVKRLEKRYKWFDPVRKWFKDLTRFKLVDDLVFMFRFIKQPADSFYYIKKNLRGSLRFAMIIYALVVVLRVAILYVTGFIFNNYVSLSDIKPLNEIIYTVLALFIWNAANYLISTISDGEGRIKDVVIGTAYSLFPYVLFALPIALLTRVLSLNEVFIYSLGQNLIYAWVGLMLFIMVKEIHNYSFGETLKNILLTIFTMGLFLLTGYILYVLFNQLFDFISAILQEVRLRG